MTLPLSYSAGDLALFILGGDEEQRQLYWQKSPARIALLDLGLKSIASPLMPHSELPRTLGALRASRFFDGFSPNGT